MSATIFWEPVSKNSKHLSVSAPSSFLSKLEAVGICVPGSVDSNWLPTLKGMAAVFEYEPNPFAEMIDLIERYGEIRLWAEY